ncbi:MAG: alpha/beta hydrolase [Phycisphaerales bacterium]|nr:alpha/beta hydrolase [Phycisphaerales bacterium]
MPSRTINARGFGTWTPVVWLLALAGVCSAQAPPELAEEPLGDVAPIETHLDITYVQQDGADDALTSLDIYAPTIGEDHPVLVYIHGGAWRIGDKVRVGAKPAAFVGEGYVFISINYRLSPAVAHPEHVRDVAAAVAWTHANVAQYGGDPDRIYIMGHSAGAHLAALVATDDRRLAEWDLPLTTIKGVVLLDGAAYDIAGMADMRGGPLPMPCRAAFGSDREGWDDASPINHVDRGKGIAPFLLFHAGDRVLSRQETRRLARALRRAGVRADVIHAPDKTHATLNREFGEAGDVPTRRVLTFLAGFPEQAEPGDEAGASSGERPESEEQQRDEPAG